MLPLFQTTNALPFESTTGIEPWLKLQALGSAFRSNVLPPTQSELEPLRLAGVDHFVPSHLEKKISDEQ